MILDPIPARLINRFFAQLFQKNLIEKVGQQTFSIHELHNFESNNCYKNFNGCIKPEHIKKIYKYYPEETHPANDYYKKNVS